MRRQIAMVCVFPATTAGCSSRQEKGAGPAPVPIKAARARQFEAPLLVGPREGDYVKKGQALAVIDPTDYSLGVDAAA